MKRCTACLAGKKFAATFTLLFILINNISSFAQSCDCPSVASCSECVGGLTQIKLRYDGSLGLALTVTDDGGIIFISLAVSPGTVITLNSSAGAGQLFVGGQIHFSGTLLDNTTVDTSCDTPIGQGSTFGNLTVTSATVLGGTPLCCTSGTQETTPPVISGCPTNRSAILPVGACTVPVSWTAPTVSDNCDSAPTFVSSHSPGASFGPGVTPVTYTATDEYGNVSTCTFNVTVTDPTTPTFSNCPSNITVGVTSTTCSVNVSWAPPTANDNCPVTVTSTHTPGQAFAPGVHTVIYSAQDPSGNIGTCSFTVTVNDPFLPTVTCNHPAIHVNADANCVATATWTPPVFADNCSVTVTSTHEPGATFPLGSTQVTYTGKDPSNNTRTCSFTVIVHDVTLPILAGCPVGPLSGSATTSCGAQVSWTEPTATDNCDDFSDLTITSNYSPGYFFPVGTTTVTYTALDETGNFSTCSFDVNVTDDAAPIISNCPSDIVVFADADCLTPVSWVEPSATDNCSALPFTKTHAPGNLFGLGTTTVTYTVKDPSNNTSTCSFTVTVVDNTPPVLANCPVDMVVPAAANCQAIVNFADPNVSDNCGATLSVSKASGTSFQLGETIVTFTATDAALNSSTCSFNVKVVDVTPPVFTNCPADITVNVADNCEKAVTWAEPLMSDNCGATVGISHTSGSLFPLGETIVTYTATDAALNATTCSFKVTVVDNVAPLITNCPSNITETITTGCNKSVSWVPPTIDDDCDVTMMISHNPGDVFPVGTTTVTYTATDESQNQSTCTFTVTIQDVAVPVISDCPSNITVFANANCQANVSWTEPSATDNCSVLPFTKTHTPGSLFSLGTTTVTYTVKDPSNNTSTCSFTVTVVDDTPPVLTNCPADIIVPAGTNCQAVVNFADPNVSDNCGATLVVSKASGTSFVLGETIVTFTATDAALNSSTCSFKVTVVDTSPPVLTNCPADITVNVASNCEKAVSWTAPTLADNCGATLTATHAMGSLFPLGTTTVTYEAEDAAGNSATCSFTVTVIDNVAPVITNCPGNMTLSATSSCGMIATWTPLATADDCDVTITSSHNSGDEFPIGTTTVEIEAEDESGNISTCTFDVIVEDNAAPVITCLTDITVSAGSTCDAVVTWSDPPVTDNCSATLSGNIVSGATFPLGTTPVTITASDPSGNTSTCTFNVMVVDNTAPTIQNCPADITVSANDDCQALVTWSSPAVVDNCSVTMTSSHMSGAMFNLGVTTVTYTAEDGAGNETICTFNVKVVDATAPVISDCPSDITVGVENNCETIVTWTAPTAEDNCSVTLTSSHAPGAAFSAGTTAVTYTATDPAGNFSTCSFNVIVVDSDAPTLANCPSDIQVTANSLCQATATWTAPVATDGCTLTLTSTHNSGDVFPFGMTTVTYTATDNSGNASTCSFNVIVTDTSAPVFSNCPSDITLEGDINCQANATWSAPSVADDCAFTVTSTRESGSSFPVGTTTVTYTAVDASGNTSTCSFNVTVKDAHAPVITSCPSTITLSAGPDCQASASWTPPQFADCSAFEIISSHSPGTSFPLGTTIVAYTVTDEHGLRSICSFDVVVEDQTGPVFTNCPQDITVVAGETCDAVVTWITPAANDNCSVVTMTKSHEPGQTFQLGTTPVRYTAIDAAGNVTTCEFNINVVNEHLPVITGCPGDMLLKADESGRVSAEWIEPTATVHCTDVTMESTYHPGENFSVGTTPVVYTATSGAEKISTCSFNVVVEYEELSFDVNQLVTPDGDGINDQWTLPNLEKFKDNKVVIVDRWGSVVYQATGYNNENVVWKGVNQSGVAVPTGTYYYTISVRFLSEVREKKGFIELIR